jgi:hypothetical protein
MKSEIGLSVAISIFLGTVLVWLSIVLVDIGSWHVYSVNYGASPGYPEALPAIHNTAAINGGTQ